MPTFVAGKTWTPLTFDTASQWLLCDLMKIYQYYRLGKDAERLLRGIACRGLLERASWLLWNRNF